MDVHNDFVPGLMEPEHRFRKDIARSGLHDVFHELRTIALDPHPLLLFTDTLEGNGLVAVTVEAHLRLDVCQLSTGRQHDEHDAALVHKPNTVGFGVGMLPDASGSRPVNIPPKADDFGIGLPPRIHQGFQFFFLKAHVQSAHSLKCAHRTAVAKGQFCDFAFLPEVSVDTVLLDRHMEHLGRRRAVNVAATCKDLLSPRLVCHIGDHAGLDCGEVGHEEAATFLGYKGSTN